MELDRQKGIKKKGEEKEGRNSRFQNLRDLLKSVHFHQMSFRTASWVTLYQNSSWDFSEIWSEWASLCSGDLAPLPSMPKWPRPTLTVDGNTPQGTNTVSSSPCPCLELPLLSLLVIWFPSSPLLFPPSLSSWLCQALWLRWSCSQGEPKVTPRAQESVPGSDREDVKQKCFLKGI